MSEHEIDPITLGSIWRSLAAIANDAGRSLQRTAFSEAVREGHDFSVALFDADARMIAQGDFSPGHLGSMPQLVRHVLDVYPRESMRPGDAFVLNDPWMGSGHLPDFLLTTPVFRGDDLVSYVVSCVHMIDVGGAVPGSQAVAGINDHYQEGLRLLPTRLWSAGEPQLEVLRIIEANVRVPDKLLGDLNAMRSCNYVGEQEILALVDRVGLDVFTVACDAILDRSEEAMRASIAEIANGTYHAVDYLDDCGPGTDPVRIEVTVTVDDDRLTIDFEGSDPQTRSGINGVANYVRAYCYFTIKVVTHGASLPQNAGSLRPIEWRAPEGSVMNAMAPVGAGARAIMQQRVVDVLMTALAPVLPTRVVAPSSHWANPVLGGVDPTTGRTFVFYDIVVGGFGGRSASDGVEAMCPSLNIDGIPAEVNEHSYPLVVERYELIRNSAAPGRWRGGHGVRKDVRMLGNDMLLSNLAERQRVQPRGLFGGESAPVGETIINPGDTERRIHGKGKYSLRTGDVISTRLCGGAGYGDPLQRPVSLVVADVRAGLLSLERAAAGYGVVIGEGLVVDKEMTQRQRRANQASRDGRS